MNRNLPQPSYPDGVQGSLTFEAAEYPLDGWPEFEQGNPLWGISGLSHRFLVNRIRVDDGLRVVVSPDGPSQRVRGIPLVANDEASEETVCQDWEDDALEVPG